MLVFGFYLKKYMKSSILELLLGKVWKACFQKSFNGKMLYNINEVRKLTWSVLKLNGILQKQ